MIIRWSGVKFREWSGENTRLLLLTWVDDRCPFLSFINRAGINIDFFLFRRLQTALKRSHDETATLRATNREKTTKQSWGKMPFSGFQNKLYLTSVVKPWSELQLLEVQDRVSDVSNFTVRVVCLTLIWGRKWVDEIRYAEEVII